MERGSTPKGKRKDQAEVKTYQWEIVGGEDRKIQSAWQQAKQKTEGQVLSLTSILLLPTIY